MGVRRLRRIGRFGAGFVASAMKHEIPPPVEWQEALDAYLAWLRSIRRAESTVKQHSYHLRRYAATTGRPPWPVTLEQLIAYLGTLDHLGGDALRLTRQVLRGFYKWGHLVGRAQSDPSIGMPPIKATPGVPRPAPEHAVKVGRRAADERVRLMIELAVNGGLRCCEIATARTDDVFADLVGWSLLVRGKGGRERSVPLPNVLAELLRAHEAGWLFPGRIGGHLSPARVSELISEALPPGVTAHALRHRYATRAYVLGGRDIRAVQDLLGHAYVTTTQVYTRVDDEAKRQAALAAAS